MMALAKRSFKPQRLASVSYAVIARLRSSVSTQGIRQISSRVASCCPALARSPSNQATEQAVQAAGMKLRSYGIADISELDDALLAIKQSGSTSLVVQSSPFTCGQRGRIIASAMKSGLGTLFAFPVAAREGSLVAYGPDYLHMYRRAPFYVDRVLKGTNPADLPVEQPAKVELLVNLQTAKMLGIEVPLSLLIRADELLE